MFWRLGKIIPPLRNNEKVKFLETNVPQKPDDLRLTDNTKKRSLYNQVKPSCFSPVSVHMEIFLDKNQ